MREKVRRIVNIKKLSIGNKHQGTKYRDHISLYFLIYLDETSRNKLLDYCYVNELGTLFSIGYESWNLKRIKFYLVVSI